MLVLPLVLQFASAKPVLELAAHVSIGVTLGLREQVHGEQAESHAEISVETTLMGGLQVAHEGEAKAGHSATLEAEASTVTRPSHEVDLELEAEAEESIEESLS
jgi:hypothetical protein